MKLLVSLLLLLFGATLFAQQDSVSASHKSRKPNMATIRLTDGSKAKGWFYSMNDSQVLLLSSAVRQLKTADAGLPGQSTSFSVNRIQSISLKKKGATLKGTLLGFGIGAVAGVIIGFASGDDPVASYPPPGGDPTGFGGLGAAIQNAFALTAAEKAVGGGILLGFTGAITGTLIGALVKKKFLIGGKQQRYRDLQGELMTRLMVAN